MFRNYVESTLTLILSLLVTTPPSLIEVHQCLGKCLSALLTTLGPELQDTSRGMTTTRSTCLACCAIIQNHPDAIVQSAAIACSQQLQLFAPQYVSLPEVVPLLCRNLDSSHLLLRRAAANCLRQFAQRDPNMVWNLARMVWNQDSQTETEERGLEHVVLAKLDSENDQKLCADLREILFSLLTSLAPENPMKWLQLCNSVLAAVNEQSGQGQQQASQEASRHAEGRGEDMDEDMAKFTTGEEQQPATKISPRWPTKEFAVECSRKIYKVCKSDPAHFDLSLAQRQKQQKGGLFHKSVVMSLGIYIPPPLFPPPLPSPPPLPLSPSPPSLSCRRLSSDASLRASAYLVHCSHCQCGSTEAGRLPSSQGRHP